MRSDGLYQRQSIRLRTGVVVAVLAAVVTGCGRSGAGSVDPTPTYIPQPTPDPTMSAVIQGNGMPVSFLPPLEVKGSPTPLVAAPRPTAPAGSSRTAPKPAPTAREVAPAREPARVREPAPTARPAPTVAAPRPAAAPTAARPANSNPAPANTGGGGAAPAVINPSNILPGGPPRSAPTPGR